METIGHLWFTWVTIVAQSHILGDQAEFVLGSHESKNIKKVHRKEYSGSDNWTNLEFLEDREGFFPLKKEEQYAPNL